MNTRLFLTRLFFVAVIIAAFYFSTSLKTSDESASKVAERETAATSLVEPVLPQAPSIPEKEVVNEATKALSKNTNELSRFETLRKKVLLNREEVSEKEKVLSNIKTVQWAESYLSAVPENNPETKKHFSAIDFLEEAITWKENPIRNEAIGSIENAIKTNQLPQTKKELRNLVVGDKIDLFTVLVQEEPSKARALLTGTDDPWIRDILNYAIKRLALEKKLTEIQ